MNWITAIAKELELDYIKQADQCPTEKELKADLSFQKRRGIKGWEMFFCPERNYYLKILKKLNQNDVVFDVGAGDLRFDLMMSVKVKKVYAVEINPLIVGRALTVIGYNLPSNLIPICGNAFEMDLPKDVTVITCLMIHREHEFHPNWGNKRIFYTERKTGFHKFIVKK